MSYIMCRRADNPSIVVILKLDTIIEVWGCRQGVPWASPVHSVVRVDGSSIDGEFMEHPWIIAKALWDSGWDETAGVKEALDGKWDYPWRMPT